eukprot:8480861-Pyramimonas_sp.AAC.1
MYTDKGVPVDIPDACADDPSFATVEPAARCPIDTVVAIYVKEPKILPCDDTSTRQPTGSI